MTQVPGSVPAEAFFLRIGSGQRYCLYRGPMGDTVRGAVLYVAPFAEEMNKARRMAALQARMLAAQGFGVLQIDLFGCGDSSGEFSEARWQTWKEDLAAAHAWLSERLGLAVTLWGLRLGALLALDYLRTVQQSTAGLVLWQPVSQGSAYLTQFLRLRVASEMLAEGAERGAGPGSGGTQALRDELNAGKTLEIAGYELSAELAKAIDGLNAAELFPACAVHWLEVVADAERPVPPAATRVINAWQAKGAVVHARAVAGPQFWTTQEIEEAPALLVATSSAFLELATPSLHAHAAGHGY